MSTLSTAAAITIVVGSVVRLETRVLVLCEYKTPAAKEEMALTVQAYVAQNKRTIWFRDCRTWTALEEQPQAICKACEGWQTNLHCLETSSVSHFTG